MNRLILLLVIILPEIAIGQFGLSYPYYLTSPNKEYYLKSIPHASQMYHEHGRTDIYKTLDSSITYTIDRYFDPDGIILSNDGNTILYARYTIYNYDEFDEEIILIYKNGELKETYKLEELVTKNLDDYQYPLFYRNWNAFEWIHGKKVFDKFIPAYERKIIDDPLFTDGDTAFLATKDNELLQISLESGNIVQRDSIDNSSETITTNFNKQNLSKPQFKTPGVRHMPNLCNGLEYHSVFAEKFGYKYDGFVTEERFKYYSLDLTCLIDHHGNCLEAYVDFEDSTMNQEIRDYFLNARFDSYAVPDVVEKWYFYHSSSYRKIDSTIAINERLLEKKDEERRILWRMKQDSLDGVYIPKDLEDCFEELDQIMTPNNREKFKNSHPINYHFGLGQSLRNSWGLWRGSRLKTYFINLGVKHPDNMSGIILDTYHLYLNGKQVNLDEQLMKYNIIPRPKIEPRSNFNIVPDDD